MKQIGVFVHTTIHWFWTAGEEFEDTEQEHLNMVSI
jgi:hypothetical protein